MSWRASTLKVTRAPKGFTVVKRSISLSMKGPGLTTLAAKDSEPRKDSKSCLVQQVRDAQSRNEVWKVESFSSESLQHCWKESILISRNWMTVAGPSVLRVGLRNPGTYD